MTYHLVAEGLAYVDPECRTLCCLRRLSDLPDNDMIVHSIADAPADDLCILAEATVR